MRTDFGKDLARVLRHEGGKVDDPADPGGRTNKGVTQRVYTGWLRSQKLAPADVWSIKPEHVAAIYKTLYWDKVSGDLLPTGVCYAVFDAAVNSGVSRGILWLQIALGTVRADGVMGPATLKAVEDFSNYDELVMRMVALRLKFVRALKTYKRFGKGWERRYAQVRTTGLAEASGQQAPPVSFVAMGYGKANLEDAKKAPPTKEAAAVATGSSGGGFASTALEKVEAFSMVPSIATLVTIGTLTLFLIAGLAGAYLWWASRKRKALDEALNVVREAPIPANDNDAGGNQQMDEEEDMIVHLANQEASRAA